MYNYVIDYGRYMPPIKQKSNKFSDIIDEFNNFNNCKTTDFMKRFTMLKERIESHNPSIDEPNLRWVMGILEEIEDGINPNVGNLKFANDLWRKWK